MAIKAVLFDFTGVLTTSRVWFTLAEKLSARFGLEKKLISDILYEHEAMLMRGRKSTHDFWEENFKKLEIPLDVFKEEFSHWYVLNPEVLEIAGELKKKFRLVIFSDNFDAVTSTIRADPALKIFDEMFFSNEMHKTKQEEGTFEDVLEKLKLKPKECVFIDDKEKNLEPAKALGIKTVLFDGVKSITKISAM